MKIFKFFAIALVSSLLVASSVKASNVEDKSNTEVKSAENALREQLANALSNVSIEDQDVVYLQFTVTPDNGIKIINVEGENKDLASKVKQALSAKPITVPTVLEGNYSITVRFVNR
jgi:hypothetical protein